MKDVAINVLRKKASRVISLTVVSLAMMLPMAPSAFAQELQLRVDPVGNLLDMTGKTVGRLIEFTGEMPELTLDATGNILDASKRVVGKMVVGTSTTTLVPSQNIGTLLATPPGALSTSPATVVTTPAAVVTTEPAAVVSSTTAVGGRTTTTVTSTTTPTETVIRRVTLIDDVNFRRNEVATNISDRLASGKITAAQAAALKGLLDAILPAENIMRKSGGLDFRESKRLYWAFDRIASELDDVSSKPNKAVAAIRVLRLD